MLLFWSPQTVGALTRRWNKNHLHLPEKSPGLFVGKDEGEHRDFLRNFKTGAWINAGTKNKIWQQERIETLFWIVWLRRWKTAEGWQANSRLGIDDARRGRICRLTSNIFTVCYASLILIISVAVVITASTAAVVYCCGYRMERI